MTVPHPRGDEPENPWRDIDLGVYEAHMSDERVGQTQHLHAITRDQIAAHPPRRLAVLGVAGGNGLDLVDPETTEAVFAYDVNSDYLAVCGARYRDALGDRLHLIEARVDRTLIITRVDLLIANLLVEYVGMDEFAAFVAANRGSIGAVSTVIQHNVGEGFVSSTPYTDSFTALASMASEIDPDSLETAMTRAGMDVVHRSVHALPNGKQLVRQDFVPRGVGTLTPRS